MPARSWIAVAIGENDQALAVGRECHLPVGPDFYRVMRLVKDLAEAAARVEHEDGVVLDRQVAAADEERIAVFGQAKAPDGIFGVWPIELGYRAALGLDETHAPTREQVAGERAHKAIFSRFSAGIVGDLDLACIGVVGLDEDEVSARSPLEGFDADEGGTSQQGAWLSSSVRGDGHQCIAGAEG